MPTPPMSGKKNSLQKYIWHLPAFTLLTLLCVGLALAQGFDANIDLLIYHQYVAHAFLENRHALDIAPAYLPSFLNPMIDILPYLAFRHLCDTWVTAALAIFQSINLWFVYLLTHKFVPLRSAWLRWLLAMISAGIGVTGSLYFGQLGINMGDSLVSVFVLAALYLATFPAKSHWLVMSPLLLGFAAGLKNSQVYLLPSYFLFLFILQRCTWRQLLGAGGAMLGGMLVSNGHWWYLQIERYGNPFFPFLNHIFDSPYINYYQESVFRFNRPQEITGYLIKPLQWTLPNNAPGSTVVVDLRWLLFSLLIPIYFISRFFAHNASWQLDRRSHNHLTLQLRWPRFSARTDRFLLAAVIFSLTAFFCWQFVFSMPRFVVPLELLLSVLLVLLLFRLQKYLWRHRRFGAVASFVTLLACAAYVHSHKTLRFPHDGKKHAVEVLQPEAFENAVVLISNWHPLSFLIPYLPTSARFLGYGDQITGFPGLKSDYNRRLADKNHVPSLYEQTRDLMQKAAPGKLFELTTVTSAIHERKMNTDSLQALGFRKDWANCRRVITTRVYRHGVFICPLKRN